MSVMTAPDLWSGQERALTVEDMENMPDDEFRYELDDGVLIVSLAPSTLHQLAVARLTVILSAACPAGFVVLPGVGVNITKFQHRVPEAGRMDRCWQAADRQRSAEARAGHRGVPRARHRAAAGAAAHRSRRG